MIGTYRSHEIPRGQPVQQLHELVVEPLDRQLDILQYVALGQTNAEIARAIFVGPRTVEMHVADILARLDCHTRTEAVRKAGELNLLKTILP